VAPVLEASHVASSLRKTGILVRYFTNPILSQYFRVSVGRPSDSDALVLALKTIQQSIWETYVPHALIWDMDGVLADVSQSYRQAIIKTASVFGVEISHHDIAQAKMAGNANNDWVLTHRLIAKAGVSTDLKAVTEKFEDFYQNELRFLEKLLVSREILTKFRDLLPMVIVTGRPRNDAQNFLNTHNISEFFQFLVCMEDAPAKPDPGPIQLVLQKLKISRAVMIGDTPDDIRASVGAGIVGVGILSPTEKAGSRTEFVKEALISSGAACVVESVEELFGICSRLKNNG